MKGRGKEIIRNEQPWKKAKRASLGYRVLGLNKEELGQRAKGAYNY
jgi:hypothetical protein